MPNRARQQALVHTRGDLELSLPRLISTFQLALHSRQFGFELLCSFISHWLSPVQDLTRHYDPYLVHDNHFRNR